MSSEDDDSNRDNTKGITMPRPMKQYSQRLKRHQDAILCMYAPNPQAGLMVSGSADEHIRIWDMEQKIISKYISIERPTDSALLKYQNIDKDNMPKYASEKKDQKDDPNDPMRGVKRKIQSVFLTSFAFMGPLIFTGYEDGLICEWAIETGNLNFPMLGHSNRVNHLLAADTHDFIYSSSNDCTVRQWDVITGQCVNIYKFADPVSVSRLQPENDFLYTASWDKVVRVIDLEKNLIQKSFIASKETIKEMLVTDELIIVAGCDPVIRGYNLETGKVKNFVGHQGWVYCLYISKMDENLLYSGGDDKCVRIWDISQASCIEELRAHRNGVTSICICGNRLYTGSFDHYIVEYDYPVLLERILEKQLMRSEDVLSRKIEVYHRALAERGLRRLALAQINR